jgi:hypothetical protein
MTRVALPTALRLPMKGPGNRLKFVIRRAWECPQCHRRLVTPGSVVQQACNCRTADADAAPVWMKLIKDPLRTSRRDVNP